MIEPSTHISGRRIPDRLDTDEIIEKIRDVIAIEALALSHLVVFVDESYVKAVSLLYACTGKIVVTGVGKSGLIARKIAATFNSTGTRATFLHPSDALHGDLGVLDHDDIVLAIGKSGESEELLQLLPSLRDLGVKLIALTSKDSSTLAQAADLVLCAPINKEACPLDLAPTVSTTVFLAIGDALALTLMQLKNFKAEDFAKFHPGGKLGKRLTLKVSDLMIPISKCPVLDPQKNNLEDVIFALSEFSLGIILFSENKKDLCGVLTDGDIRRLLNQHRTKIFELKLDEVMNRNPITISKDMMAVDALKLMEERERPLNVFPVMEGLGMKGIIRLHELVSVG